MGIQPRVENRDLTGILPSIECATPTASIKNEGGKFGLGKARQDRGAFLVSEYSLKVCQDLSPHYF